MDVNLASMATILIYFIEPVVVFGAVAHIKLQPQYFVLPVSLAAASITITLVSYQGAKYVFDRSNFPNLIAIASPTSNSGYFGLPIILAFFGVEASGIYLMGNLGADIVMVTMGYYFGACGGFDVRESIIKVLKLPVLYGIILGLLYNLTGYELSSTFQSYWTYFTGAWVVVGMMLIGVALGKLIHFRINFKLLSYLSLVKFGLWPLMIFLAILFDRNITQAFDSEVYAMFMVWSLCPLMANTVAYAAQLNVRPDEAAMCVLITTIFALFYMPLVLYFTGFINFFN